MTEFALVIPVFLTFLLVLLEFGALFRIRASYQEGALQAVRVDAAAGQSADADWQALNQSIKTLAIPDLTAISSVTIYDATTSGGYAVPPSTTVTDTAHTTYVYSPTVQAFVCKVSQLQAPNPCDLSKESFWSPSLSRNVLGSALDHVGIEITYRYKGVTPLFPARIFTQTASVLMEPQGY